MVIFKDRLDAGEKLAKEIGLRSSDYHDPIVLGIPRGGIAVGYPLCEKLSCPLMPVTLRKLPLPTNDQMGFGVVTIDKEVILNESLMYMGYISRDEIEPIVEEVYCEVRRRDEIYRGAAPFPDLKGRSVFIADDGLATGYTMIGAVRFARSRGAEDITVCVPVAHIDAYNLVKKEKVKIITLHLSRSFLFAIASFYKYFPDLKDSEVLDILSKAKEPTIKNSVPA